MTGALRVAVVIASKGRPDELACWTTHLVRQTLSPHHLVLSVTGDEDLPDPSALYPGARIIRGSAGAAIQRNRGIDLIRDDCDVIAFFDDDYVPADGCIAGIAALFAAYPDIVGANGVLLADGINTSGIGRETAGVLIAGSSETSTTEPRILREVRSLYGCHMVFRASAIGDRRFDERLPLYSWLEDVDFAKRVLAGGGRMVKTDAFVGVHLGAKGGRTSGVRFGYSQVVNPVYLVRKGSLPLTFAAQLMLRNIVMNHLLAIKPEPWVDRLGRAKGNWIGLIDTLRGRSRPERILDL